MATEQLTLTAPSVTLALVPETETQQLQSQASAMLAEIEALPVETPQQFKSAGELTVHIAKQHEEIKQRLKVVIARILPTRSTSGPTTSGSRWTGPMSRPSRSCPPSWLHSTAARKRSGAPWKPKPGARLRKRPSVSARSF